MIGEYAPLSGEVGKILSRPEVRFQKNMQRWILTNQFPNTALTVKLRSRSMTDVRFCNVTQNTLGFATWPERSWTNEA